MTRCIDIVSETVAAEVVSMVDAIAAVDAAFVDLAAGRSALFPVALGQAAGDTGRFGAKLGRDGASGVPGLKVGTYWPGNRARGLVSHGSTTLLLDPATGFPAALVAASHLTALRTAASDAVAVRALARPDATVLAIIGSGHQAWFEAVAVAAVRPLTRILVAGRNAEGAAALAARLRAAGLPAEASAPEAAVRAADIVVTVTPSQAPLVAAGWVRPGTHISAMGADEPVKAELDPALFARARLFADLPEQSARIGEFSQAVAAGILDANAITGIGDVLRGASGRTGATDVTIFDSSGTALQDLAVALLALDRARAAGRTVTVDLG